MKAMWEGSGRIRVGGAIPSISIVVAEGDRVVKWLRH
jgi:hypothetical protein